MPWIKEDKLYLIVVLLLVFIMAIRAPIDSDMWWHLRAGEETIDSGHVYRIDMFSSSRAGEEWVNHSWLSQIMMALLLRIGNFPALSIWVAVCAVISMGLVYVQMKGHPLLRAAIIVLAAMVSSVVWSPRPQIMSLVLLAFLSWLVFNFRERRSRAYLVGIPLIFALWGNLHGGYVLGLIYLGAFLSGELLDRIMLLDREGGLSWKEIGLVAIVMVLGFVLVLVNPFGLEMWKIPFNTIGVETLQNLINEWASPDFHLGYQQPLLWMLLGLLVTLGLSGKKLRGYQLLPVVIFTWAAMVARRNFGPFAIVCAPALSVGLSALLDEWAVKARESWPRFNKYLQSAEENKENFNAAARNLINVTLIGLLLVTATIKTIQVNQPELIADAEKAIFPVDAVEWIKENGQFDAIFNEYNWGGYLIYHLPEIPVFVDGRTDLFGDEILNDYLAVMQIEKNWQEILNKYGLDILLLQNQSNLGRYAIQEGWTVLYKDEVAILLARQ